MRKLLLFVFFAIPFLAVSCGEAQKDSEVLIANQWKLKSLSSVQQVNMPELDSYTLSFDTVDNRLFGRANCNLYFADYKLGENNLILVNQPGATMMMCQNDNAEKQYLDMLEEIKSFNITDDNLEFLSIDSTVLSVFIPHIQETE